MRIGFDAKRAFYNDTGLGHYSRYTIRTLSGIYKEHEYFLYTSKRVKSKDLSFLENKENVFVRNPFSFLGNLSTYYWRSKDIVQDLIQDDINIYHGLSHELPIGIENSGIKSIVTIHDLIFIRYPHFFSRIDRAIYTRKIKSSCRRSNKIIAISEQTKSDIIDFLNIDEEKIQVIYQGCNTMFQSSLTEKIKKRIKIKYNLPDEYLLTVGTIEERKNLLLILRSLKELPEKKLVVIGNGKKYKKKCEQYIQDNNLTNKVIFLSGIDMQDIVAIYQQASMLIYPSIVEGFGRPILEALFSKIPVITSKGGCFAESGGNDSIYIDPLCNDDLTEAILLIDKNKSYRESMIKNGWEYAQKFSEKNISRNLMKLYMS